MASLIRHSTLLANSALLILSGVAAADTITRDFDVTTGGKLIVQAERAKLVIRGGGGDRLQVAITRGNDDAGEIEDDYDIDFSQQGDEVRVDLKHRRKWSPSNWFSRSLVIEVDLPARFDVDLQTSGGSVDVQGLTGVIRAKTSGGSLHFEDVDGPIHGRTSGGSIYLEGTSGDADLRTSGGSIRVGEVDGQVQARTSGGGISVERAGGPVLAKTSGGGIEVGEVHGAIEASTSGGGIRAGIAAQPLADSRLTTSGGSVTVSLGPSIAINLDAKASGGRVRSDLPITMRGSFSKSSIEGDLNGGGPRLYLRASGGSVNLQEL